MASNISAFGYTVPLTVVLVFIALVIGLALVVMFWLTTVWSIYRSIGTTRREQVHDEMRDRLVDGMFDPEEDWQWVGDCSGVEREVLESLLDEYLRELDGQNVEKLRELGEKLGIPDRSKRRLAKRGEYTHLSALTWLALLGRPDVLRDTSFSPSTPRERAAVARLRYETADLEGPREGISILLEGSTSQFSVFGQDTLYRIALEDPGVLFEVAAANSSTWSDSLLVQVLVVCQQLGANVTTEDLSWLIGPLEDENEAIRENATLALGRVGWRNDVREDPFFDRLVSDSSPRVRAAAYRTLARWGDEQALETLTEALQNETDPRARLAGTEALVSQREQLPAGSPPELGATWVWSKELAEYDDRARSRPQVGD